MLGGLLLLAHVAGAAQAQFRQFIAIPTPTSAPAGFAPAAVEISVPRAVFEQAIRDFFAAWNTPALDAQLSERFLDRSRLLDELYVSAPRDARLHLRALRALQVVEQLQRGEPDGSVSLLHRVSAVVTTQVEFEDPQLGFVSLEGEHEYHFRITVQARP